VTATEPMTAFARLLHELPELAQLDLALKERLSGVPGDASRKVFGQLFGTPS